jgi:hypothetical protein
MLSSPETSANAVVLIATTDVIVPSSRKPLLGQLCQSVKDLLTKVDSDT